MVFKPSGSHSSHNENDVPQVDANSKNIPKETIDRMKYYIDLGKQFEDILREHGYDDVGNNNNQSMMMNMRHKPVSTVVPKESLDHHHDYSPQPLISDGEMDILLKAVNESTPSNLDDIF